MLSKPQLEQIKTYLEQSQNPLFFFDNDVDGLCSFLILQRAIGRGKGVAVKSFPDLNKSYLRKIEELNPDIVFILDKPKVEKDFIKGVYDKGIKIIWIDHHEVPISPDVLEKVEYFNSYPSAEPVTYLCYKIFEKKSEQWIAMIGCIGDVYISDFAKEFSEKYPELFNSKLNAFDSLYQTEIGKIVRMLNFGLKDTTTNVLNLMKYLLKAKDIHDILEENKFTKQLHHRYTQLKKALDKLVLKAESQINDSKLLFFSYSGETSMSSELSNEIYSKHKDKLVVVAFKKQDKVNVSIRGKNAKKITLKIIELIENSSGGGHEEATGAQIPLDKLDEFKQQLEKLV